jgi:hypothetical protein
LTYKIHSLCEAELGKPLLELTHADYNAGDRAKQQGSFSTWGQGSNVPLKWKDAGVVNPQLEGVSMVSVLSILSLPHQYYLLTFFQSRMSLFPLARPRSQGLIFSTMSTLFMTSLRFASAIYSALI